MRGTRIRGYNLLELMVTLTLAATVVLLGVPSFNGFLADKRVRAETDALFHAIHLARKSSVVRRRVVTLCPSLDGASCDAEANWSGGWIMFEEQGSTGTGVRSPNEILLDHHPVDDQVRVSANRAYFAFRSTQLRATNGTLHVCDTAGHGRDRTLVVSYTGRPRVDIRQADEPGGCT